MAKGYDCRLGSISWSLEIAFGQRISYFSYFHSFSWSNWNHGPEGSNRLQ